MVRQGEICSAGLRGLQVLPVTIFEFRFLVVTRRFYGVLIS